MLAFEGNSLMECSDERQLSLMSFFVIVCSQMRQEYMDN